MIELLVVVTIIVVLVALLTPALDRAIYSAEMAVCTSPQHMLATTAITYAMGQERYCPPMPNVQDSFKRSRLTASETGEIAGPPRGLSTAGGLLGR